MPITNVAAGATANQTNITSPDNGQRTKRIMLGRMLKLKEGRYGIRLLPDDDGGRAMLKALLCLGLNGDRAFREAREWLTEAKLRKLQRESWWMKWTRIGPLIGLTYEERETYKLWRFMPVDVSAEEVERRLIEKRKKSWRESKQRAIARRVKKMEQERERVSQLPEAKRNRRRAAVLRMLSDGEYWSVSQLMAEAMTCEAFQRALGSNTHYVMGPPPFAIVRNLRDAVHETLSQLGRRGRIEIKFVPGERGYVKLVRLLAPSSNVLPPKSSVGNEHRSIGNPISPKLHVIQGDKAKKGVSTAQRFKGSGSVGARSKSRSRG